MVKLLITLNLISRIIQFHPHPFAAGPWLRCGERKREYFCLPEELLMIWIFLVTQSNTQSRGFYYASCSLFNRSDLSLFDLSPLSPSALFILWEVDGIITLLSLADISSLLSVTHSFVFQSCFKKSNMSIIWFSVFSWKCLLFVSLSCMLTLSCFDCLPLADT